MVQKSTKRATGSERTVATATIVDGDERVAELSRMLAGVGRLVARPPPRRRAARDRGAPRRDRESVPALSARDAADSAGKVPAEVVGPAKVDRRTKDMIRRLVPGDIAVIDHVDLDRVAADGLIEAGVAAVVNASESISGRYPNGGPIRRRASRASRSLDAAGTDLLDRVHEGDTAAHRRRRDLARRRARRHRQGAHRGRDRSGDGRRARRDRRRARTVRRQHARVRAARGATHVRAARVAAAAHEVRGTSRAGGRARPRLPQRPRRAALRTSASTGRCSSASTAAPTRCSRSG